MDQTQFDNNFGWSFFRADGSDLTSALLAIGKAGPSLGGGATTDDSFWRDPFTTPFINFARTNSEKIKQMRLSVESAQEQIIRNEKSARRNRSSIDGMMLAARKYDHRGRRYEVMQKFSDQYWDAYLNLGDRTKARRLRYYYGAIYNNLREMAEELSILKEDYRKQWLAENRPYWLESVLARYDQMISIWLVKSRAMDEAMRKYEATSTLPSPEEFGLGTRPVPPTQR